MIEALLFRLGPMSVGLTLGPAKAPYGVVQCSENLTQRCRIPPKF